MDDPRAELLRELKLRGTSTPAELAEVLGVTAEAVRQRLATLAENGWVKREVVTRDGRGRPAHAYRLTDAAEARFPKFYDALTLAMIRSLDEKFGDDGLETVLADITDRQVDAWRPRVDGKPLDARMRALRDVYFDDDPFTEVKRDADGVMLVEHNCPYLAAAAEEPRLCSVTVSTMKRLLGVEVERTDRFQRGDGRCVFRVREDEPVKDGFRFGWESS